MTDAPQGGQPVADGGSEPPVVRDKRRIDPQTGQVRDGGRPPGAEPGGHRAPRRGQRRDGQRDRGRARAWTTSPAASRRTSTWPPSGSPTCSGCRPSTSTTASASSVTGTSPATSRSRRVLESLLPVMDDVHLARQHGDLESGPFAAVADKLETILGRAGLERFGEVGEAFDPAVHEALMHVQAELAAGTDVTTVVQVLQPGYRVGERGRCAPRGWPWPIRPPLELERRAPWQVRTGSRRTSTPPSVSPRTRTRRPSRRPTASWRARTTRTPTTVTTRAFKEIGEAYSVLSDPEQRQQYDAIRSMSHGGARFAPGGQGGGRASRTCSAACSAAPALPAAVQRARFDTTGDIDLEDLLRGMGGAAPAPVSAAGGGSAASAPVARAAARTSTRRRPCRSGTRSIGSTVTLRTPEGRTVTARIPAGVRDGQKIRLRGKGSEGDPGAPAGDLLIQVERHADDPVFGRQGDDLTVTVPVTFAGGGARRAGRRADDGRGRRPCPRCGSRCRPARRPVARCGSRAAASSTPRVPATCGSPCRSPCRSGSTTTRSEAVEAYAAGDRPGRTREPT